jgi:hypothetical protein
VQAISSEKPEFRYVIGIDAVTSIGSKKKSAIKIAR